LIEINHYVAERSLRSVALMYSLIGTATLNGINPQAYLTCVLKRIADHQINQIDILQA
jgi:transposase